MKIRTALAAAVAATTLATFGVVSQATVITAVTNNPLNFTWEFFTPGGADLEGNGSLTVTGFNTNSLSVVVTLNNTSSEGGQGGERLTSFGFGINPNATSVGFTDAADGGMVDAGLASIPSLSAIEVCAWGGNNCAGGGGGGIFAGTSDTFTLLLAGTWGSSVDVAPIGFKYQTGAGSFEFFSSSSSTSSGPATSSGPVPEPSSSALALLGFALLGGTLFRRARRR